MRSFAILMGAIVLLCVSCGGDGGSEPVIAPSIPGGLSAQGSLGKIELAWEASAGGGLIGYNIYRSGDGTTFTRLNDDPVTEAAYEDTSVEDGVYYSFKVTSVGDKESDFSDVVRQMHGTRLLPSYDSGCILEPGALNPFVAEDSVEIGGGNLEIQSGATLYVLDNAVIDVLIDPAEANPEIRIRGLLRVMSAPSDPATLTAHATDGALPDGRGQLLQFYDESIDYDPDEGSGDLLQNCYIENLSQGDGAIRLVSNSPRFYNCRISSNKTTGGSYFTISNGSAPIIENCHITRLTIKIATDMRGTGASITRNYCRGSYYTIYFFGSHGPGMIDPGQVAQNDFDGTVHGLYMYQVDEGDIPLGDNYWDGGLPDIVGGAGTPVFEPVLDTPPADCGPTW